MRCYNLSGQINKLEVKGEKRLCLDVQNVKNG